MFCIDFRYLNKFSKFDPYPMPRIDDLLERVGRSRFITTLDITQGYWQLPMAPEAKDVTAFKNSIWIILLQSDAFWSPRGPQRHSSDIWTNYWDITELAAAYLDDVIYSQTWEEHLQHLQCALRRIRSEGLTINPHKCTFTQRQVRIPGLYSRKWRHQAQVGKVEAIQQYPVPTTKKNVQASVGLVGWYRTFISQFSERTAVLTEATASNEVEWGVWTELFKGLKGAGVGSPQPGFYQAI